MAIGRKMQAGFELGRVITYHAGTYCGPAMLWTCLSADLLVDMRIGT